jgi:N-acetylglutamate synthase-like GNAT family acetyltransferase
VGFAHVEVLEPNAAHLEEIDVHPAHGRRGLGTKLVMHVCDWATAAGYEAVSLSTFRDVPWNMPFYARLGFTVVPDSELGSALRAVVDDERRRGLDPSRRVVMQKGCARRAPTHTRSATSPPETTTRRARPVRGQSRRRAAPG